MIQEFVDRFINHEQEIKKNLLWFPPDGYTDLVTRMIKALDIGSYDDPDPEHITIIDHGDYQGTRLFIIGAKGYQPSTYWSIFVNYGSCSGCDSFEGNLYNPYKDNADECEIGIEKEMNGNKTMMLHMVQSMKLID